MPLSRSSLVASLAMHAVLLLVVIFGLPWRETPRTVTAQAIPVQLVEMSQLSAAPRVSPTPRKEAKAEPEPPRPEPKPEPKPEPPKKAAAPPPEPAPPPPPEPVPPKPEPKPEPPKAAEKPPAPPKPEPKPEPPKPAEVAKLEPPKPEPKPEPPKPEPPPAAAVTPPKPEPPRQQTRKPEPKPEPPKHKPPEHKPEPKRKPADTFEETFLKNTLPKPKQPRTQDFAKEMAAALDEKQPKPQPRRPSAKPAQEQASLSAPNLSDVVTSSEKDAVAQQVGSRWNIDPGAKGIADVVVELLLVMEPDGRPSSIRILDKARYQSDPVFRTAADAAVRAVQLAVYQDGRLKLPTGKYSSWREVVLSFSPRDMGLL